MRSYRVTRTAWFGPKRYLGWGWAITNRWGLLAFAVFLALQIAITFPFWHWHGPAWALVTTHLAITALFLVVVVLTGDPPGGRIARKET